MNPEHLREGTQKENMQDMAERTTALYCRHNVLRTFENTYIRPNGARHCRCARVKALEVNDEAAATIFQQV